MRITHLVRARLPELLGKLSESNLGNYGIVLRLLDDNHSEHFAGEKLKKAVNEIR